MNEQGCHPGFFRFTAVRWLAGCVCAGGLGGATIPAAAGPGPRGGTDLPLCVLDAAKMPESWRPRGEVHASLSQEPWTPEETEEAARAVRGGLAELTAFFEEHPEAALQLGPDTVECFIDASFSAGNLPDVRDQAREQARRYLHELLPRYLNRGGRPVLCPEVPRLAALANFMHTLYPEGHEDKDRIVALVRSGLAKCGDMNVNYRMILSSGHYDARTVVRFVRYATLLVEAQTIPGIEVPESELNIVRAVWDYLAAYPLPAAAAFDTGARDQRFADIAYLVTHAGYVPTGYQRHPIYIEDAPWLYRFLRENFYDVLEQGSLDLISEFVDMFRQYGCTEETDLQTRDGARLLMRLYREADNRWMKHREPDEMGRELHAYALVHKPWTGIAGVRRRMPEPPDPGTYGGMFRELTGLPVPPGPDAEPCAE